MTISANPRDLPQAARGQHQREQLLIELERQLRSKRISEISIAELTQSAKLTRSAFYFYFPSKEAAVAALLSPLGAEATQSIKSLLGGSGAFRDRIHSVLIRLCEQVAQVPHIYQALLEARAANVDVWKIWENDHAQACEPITDFIRAERSAGRAPQGSDAAVVAYYLVKLNETLLEQVATPPEIPVRPHIDVVADLWVRAIYGHVDQSIDPTSPALAH